MNFYRFSSLSIAFRNFFSKTIDMLKSFIFNIIVRTPAYRTHGLTGYNCIGMTMKVKIV